MKKCHLGIWAALLCWQATADQILRPPAAIPTPTVIALKPARPAAIPIPAPIIRATMPLIPFPVPLPPPEFDHEYTGRLTIAKLDNYRLIRAVCEDNSDAVACTYRIYNSVTGAPISCLIMLGPGTWSDERVMQHEIGHCNGWSNNHEGAR
jgi:hypothetical protein